jgi:peptide deformylase
MKSQNIFATYPDEHLRKVCTPIETVTDEVKAFCRQLSIACVKLEGLGLAAPQVYHNVRIVAINVDHCDKVTEYGYDPGDTSSSPTQGHYSRKRNSILINPVITPLDDKMVKTKEACLSIPGVCCYVPRYKNISVSFIDAWGKPQVEVIRDCEADIYGIIVQHEVDHLDGKLFIDRIDQFEKNKVINKINKLRRR